MLLIGLIALWICPIVVFSAYVCLKKPTGEERLEKEVNLLCISGAVAALIALSIFNAIETIALIAATAFAEAIVWAIVFVIDFVINFVPWAIKKFFYKGIKNDSENIPTEDIIDMFIFTEATSND